MAIRALARAKINLALHITGQRADGFHTLDSLVAFADFGDMVSVAPSAAIELMVTGPFADDLDNGPDNLVLRAARALDSGRSASISLEKKLPVASGIGGGSANAAATLHALSELWNLPLPPMEQILQLGADLPVCLAGTPARMTGIGDIVTPLAQPLPETWLVLVNCRQPVSTPKVFQALARRENDAMPARIPDFADVHALAAFLLAQRNDLQQPAIQLCPDIAEILLRLQRQTGCLLARMSGSGGTCFGIFDSAEMARFAGEGLQRYRSGWWIQTTRLVS